MNPKQQLQHTEMVREAIERLRERGFEILETDVFYHKDRFMFNSEKEWLSELVKEEVDVIFAELREKKIDSIINNT